MLINLSLRFTRILTTEKFLKCLEFSIFSSTKLIEFVGAADVEVREASAVAGGRGGFR